MLFVSVQDIFEQYIRLFKVKNKNIQKMALLILKLFIFHHHSGKFNSFKLAAFALDISYNLIENKNSSVHELINL